MKVWWQYSWMHGCPIHRVYSVSRRWKYSQSFPTRRSSDFGAVLHSCWHFTKHANTIQLSQKDPFCAYFLQQTDLLPSTCPHDVQNWTHYTGPVSKCFYRNRCYISITTQWAEKCELPANTLSDHWATASKTSSAMTDWVTHITVTKQQSVSLDELCCFKCHCCMSLK